MGQCFRWAFNAWTCSEECRKPGKAALYGAKYGEPGVNSWANGALMQISPVAIYAFLNCFDLQRAATLAYKVAWLTHGDPLATFPAVECVLADSFLVFIERNKAEYHAWLHQAMAAAEKAGITRHQFSMEHGRAFNEIYSELIELDLISFDDWFNERKEAYGWDTGCDPSQMPQALNGFRNEVSWRERMPLWDEPFESEIVREHLEWLWMAHQSMIEWIPLDIQDKYGTFSASMVSGDCVEFMLEDEAELVEDLKKYGYSCFRDDALIEKAIGIA